MLIAMTPLLALSEEITVRLQGTITESFGDVWELPGFNVGQSYVSHYVFESTTPVDKSTSMFGGLPLNRSPYPYALKSFTASSNGYIFTSSGSLQNGILVDNNAEGKDSYFVLLSSFERELYLDLRSNYLSTFNSESLPLVLPELGNFNYLAYLRLRNFGSTGGFSYVSGTVDSISVVPEPPPAVLIAIGLLTFWLRGFPRKRSNPSFQRTASGGR